MVLLGLLLVALACLVVGLLLANAAWLVASLVVSGIAGYLLWRERGRVSAGAGTDNKQAAPKSTPRAAALATGKAFDKSKQAAGKTEPVKDVWVVDGQPSFHGRRCAAILNLETVQIPLGQALEDGFTECTVCKPVSPATGPAHVWVVDGRPDYHLEDCRSLKIAATHGERESEQIPRDQAVGDGFSPCPDCSPDGATGRPGTGATAPEPQLVTVWVVDGRPRYHLADCLIIKDQHAEEIPLGQAAEDGFMACSMCAPQPAAQSAQSGAAGS